jgi:branched-chain amino acid transport system ATP-binding protein
MYDLPIARIASQTDSPRLELSSVSVHFGGLAAVSDVSFAVAAGVVTAVVGPNGAGKTTLLNVVSGVTMATAGEVHICGRPTTRVAAFRRARLGVGRTFQTPVLVEGATVVENVMLGVAPHGFDHLAALTGLSTRRDRALRESAAEALETVGLRARADERASRLSHGQRKMVELCRALVGRPNLLLLDEPASGLHDEEVEQTARLVADYAATSGGSVLMVEHHMGLVRRVAHDVVVLDFGEVIAHGIPDVVAAQPRVIEAYLGSEAL